jgi:hypothetical protein
MWSLKLIKLALYVSNSKVAYVAASAGSLGALFNPPGYTYFSSHLEAKGRIKTMEKTASGHRLIFSFHLFT